MTAPNRSTALVPIRPRSADPIRRPADPIRIGTDRPGWDAPTGELPTVYNRGVARPSYGRPALVANLRLMSAEQPSRSWRPDLWPWWVWGPLLCAPAVIMALVFVGVLGVSL